MTLDDAEQIVGEMAEIVGELTVMRFFPADETGRLALVKLIGRMTDSDPEERKNQTRWLVKRMLELYNDWPGPIELRAVFCSRFKPKDGVNAYSKVFPAGLPQTRRDLPGLDAPALKALPPGAVASADETLDAAVKVIAEAKQMSSARNVPANRFAKELERILTAPVDREALPLPTPQSITQTDIDREVSLLRSRKAENDECASAAD